MYYEVYADVLFLEDLWMNLILLSLAAMLGGRGFGWRMIPAAAAGSLGACVLTIASAQISGAGYAAGTCVLAALMVWISFPGGKGFWYLVMYLYVTGFLFSGILRYLNQFHPLAGLAAAGVCTAAGGALYLFVLLAKRRRRKEALSGTAYLKAGDVCVLAEALLDTGNSLRDPATGYPVSILRRELLEELLDGAAGELLPHLIPYRTIDGDGFLIGYILDSMEIRLGDRTRKVTRPMVAAMPSKEGRYGLILHSDLFSL